MALVVTFGSLVFFAASCEFAPAPGLHTPGLGGATATSGGLGLLRRSGRSGASPADVLGLVSLVLISPQASRLDVFFGDSLALAVSFWQLLGSSSLVLAVSLGQVLPGCQSVPQPLPLRLSGFSR